jgi:hypothetical protein
MAHVEKPTPTESRWARIPQGCNSNPIRPLQLAFRGHVRTHKTSKSGLHHVESCLSVVSPLGPVRYRRVTINDHYRAGITRGVFKPARLGFQPGPAYSSHRPGGSACYCYAQAPRKRAGQSPLARCVGSRQIPAVAHERKERAQSICGLSATAACQLQRISSLPTPVKEGHA